jgi:4-alpha-glucanotransferase
LENGAARDGSVRPRELSVEDSRELGDEKRQRRQLNFGFPVPYGYHRFRLFPPKGEKDMQDAESCLVIVAPEKCYLPRSMDRGRRGWGYTIQLYGIRSRRNWGIGDFSDLAKFAQIAAQQGATAIGLNPLHAMFPHNPLHASPYSPSHRQFLSVLYIDPAAAPEFGECEEAQELLHSAAFQEELAELRSSEMVDYQRVAALKRPVLELLYRTFRERYLGPANEPPPSDRGAAFRRFQGLGGRELEKLGVFQAISEQFGPDRKRRRPIGRGTIATRTPVKSGNSPRRMRSASNSSSIFSGLQINS